MSIQILDPVKWIRSRPERFFSSRRPDPVQLCSCLMEDVLRFGGGSCVVRHRGGWWSVGSDRDWLEHPQYSVKELFGRVVAAPEHGRHSMRAEVLVTAFADSVWVARAAERTCIQGGAVPEDVGLLGGELAVVLFKLSQGNELAGPS